MQTESKVAKQLRLQNWASQIHECCNRPKGMTVAQWCEIQGITKSDYYYRYKTVRSACLELVPVAPAEQSVIPVQVEKLKEETSPADACVDLEVNGIIIHVTESTSEQLLKKVLQVTAYVK